VISKYITLAEITAHCLQFHHFDMLEGNFVFNCHWKHDNYCQNNYL